MCRYASAGHPPPLVATLDGRVEYLGGGRGLPLGTGTTANYRQAVDGLSQGSVLLFYTDGLIERRGRSLDEGFLKPSNRGIVFSHTDAAALLDRLSTPMDDVEPKWIASTDET